LIPREPQSKKGPHYGRFSPWSAGDSKHRLARARESNSRRLNQQIAESPRHCLAHFREAIDRRVNLLTRGNLDSDPVRFREANSPSSAHRGKEVLVCQLPRLLKAISRW